MFHTIGIGIGIDAVSEICDAVFRAEDIEHLFDEFVQFLFGGVERTGVEIALESDRRILLSKSPNLSSSD
jgi:hypothetical protein